MTPLLTKREREAFRLGVRAAAEFAASHYTCVFVSDRCLRFEDVILYKFNIRRQHPRLSHPPKRRARPAVKCSRCGGTEKVTTGPPFIERCAYCGLAWGLS